LRYCVNSSVFNTLRAQATMPTSIISMLTALFLLFSPTQAWLATEYSSYYLRLSFLSQRRQTDWELLIVGEYVVNDVYQNLTRTGTVVPTTSVTPFSTTTYFDTVAGDQVTVIQLYVSGFNPQATVAEVTATSFIKTSYYAPATITAPPTCTGTSFSYGTLLYGIAQYGRRCTDKTQ
jgi:hypothetical protein